MLFFSMATCFSVAIEKPLLLSWIFILTDFPHYQAIILNYLYLQFFLIIFLTINPNPACQLSLWEETGEPGENPRLSAECWRTLPTCDQMFDTGLEPMTSVVGGGRLDDWATEAPIRISSGLRKNYFEKLM